MWGLSLVVASGGHSSLRCVGLSVSWPLFLRSTGSRRAGSAAVAHGPSCSAACGIFPDQDSNPCPLHWQADSQPLHHQGSPYPLYFNLHFSACISFSSLDSSFLTLFSSFLSVVKHNYSVLNLKRFFVFQNVLFWWILFLWEKFAIFSFYVFEYR